MGNICRSPTAEAVFRQRVAAAGLQDRIATDSAGTHDYHTGKAPDARAQQAALRRGYDMSALRARQVQISDFAEFDYVLAMDCHNLHLLKRQCTLENSNNLLLFMEFSERFSGREVPDPYYGAGPGFERVLDMVEDAAQGLLRHIQNKLTD